MLNYKNLNDVEFEYLCQDIMSRKLERPLQRFATGKDGGIDLTDDVVTKNIIIQVKHYVKSDTKTLISSLKKELQKVKENSPKQYYVCCSKELTPQNKQDIYEIFSEYMDSSWNIISIIEIDDFLSKEENDDILRKHFKLWIESTNILQDIFTTHIFIDCETLLLDIEEDKKMFVRTSAYNKALKSLEDNKVTIILGDPGVGKTITSKMLVLHHSVLGYQVRYTTDGTNLNDLKKSISHSREKKEIILLDDCLGQAYFNMKETQTNELLALIKYINLCPNKRLLLNSRVTIYQEAIERSNDLVKSFQHKEYGIILINMSNLSNVERAKIFYNHLYFNNIPSTYFQNLKDNKNYMQIINHNNFNPRIIEHVTNNNTFNKISANKYVDFILQCLNNPIKIWENEYNTRLKKADRTMLTTIYSLTDTIVEEKMVQECYNYRLKSLSDIDFSINNFNTSLRRLQKGLIKIIDKNGKKMLSVANPSINDFLRYHLDANKPEMQNLIENSIAISQLKRLLNHEEFEQKLSELFTTQKIFDYVFENENQKENYIVWYCTLHNIQNPIYRSCFQNWINRFEDINIYEKSVCSALSVLEKIVFSNLSNYYDIESTIKNNSWISRVFDLYELENLVTLISTIEQLFIMPEREKFIEIVEKFLSASIDWYCDGVPANEFDINVSDFIYNNEDIDIKDIIENIDLHVKDLVQDEISTILHELPQDIQKSIYPLWNYKVRVYGSQSLVENYLDLDDCYEQWRNQKNNNSTLDQLEIDSIFNR